MLLLLALVAAACGGSPLPAAEYFPMIEAELVRLDRATKDLTQRFATELEAELDGLVVEIDTSVPGATDRALAEIMTISRLKIQAIIESHTGQVEVLNDRIGDLVPPRVLAVAHDDFIEAFKSWAASGEATIALLQEAPDLQALANVLTASPYADAQLRVDQACRSLSDRASGIDGGLTCPGTGIDILDVRP